MTTYSLTGKLTDSEGNQVVVGESTFKTETNAKNVRFYKENGFKGVLMLTIESEEGVKTTQSITCK